LGEDLIGGGVGFDDADTVFLVVKEVEVAGGVDFDGVELTVAVTGAEASEGKVLSVLRGGEGASCGEEAAEAGEEE